MILTYGPYAKGLAFQDGYPSAWQRMVEQASRRRGGLEQPLPELGGGRSGEMGAARLRLRARRLAAAAAARPAIIDHFSPRETQDFYDCIEWAGVQPWSNGKVGLNGISYYGINQWQVASLQPPHLAAMCIWEGAADWYRDMTHHGGISRRSGRTGTTCRSRPCSTGGRARQAQPGARRAGVRAGDAVRGGSWRRTAAISAAISSPIRSTTPITGRARRSGRG